jgi:acetyltransferase-like isoleucine patch superfamily enzyme
LPSEVSLGESCQIDETASIGVKPAREIASYNLIIGSGAIIRSNTVIYLGSTIGENLETGHNVIIREENAIGNDVCIWSNSLIDYGCKIGNRVKIHSNVYVAQFTTIEDEVFIAPGVTVANDLHPGCPFSKKCLKGPIIKKGARIGAGSVILPYVTIGEKSLIGAGSVVVEDVPPESVVVGNPGRVIKTIYELSCQTGLTDKPYKKGEGVK